MDRKKDRAHPDKRKRPIASGAVSVKSALIFAALLGALLLVWSYFMPMAFNFWALSLFLLTSAYSLYFKRIALVDIHIVAANFVVRTLAGAVLINAYPSPWLLIIIFLLAIFWATGKRKFELSRYKSTYPKYSSDFLSSLSNISAAMLLIAYILYTSTAHQGRLMITIPIATFMVFRYLFFIQTDNETVQKSERIFLDKQMLVALALWFILIVLQIYSEQI
jgi:4-hydroxybenzoate polyprenyltransferase